MEAKLIILQILDLALDMDDERQCKIVFDSFSDHLSGDITSLNNAYSMSDFETEGEWHCLGSAEHSPYSKGNQVSI